MKLPQTRPTRLLGAAAAAVVLSGAGTGVALAASGTPTPAPNASTHAKAHTKAQRGPLLLRFMRRATHGELVLNTKKGPQTVDFQRGVVTAVSPSSVTLASRGYSHTYSLTSASRIAAPHAKGTKATSSDVAVKDRAVVLATPNGSSAVRFLAAHPVHATSTASGSAASGA